MQENARVAAAIEIIDQILTGAPAEKALTNWARRSRFAGSKDRAAIRDLVFDALRQKRSFAWRGNGETGRGIMIGAVRAGSGDPAEVFTGHGHAPAALDAVELAEGDLDNAPEGVRLDLPDWILPEMRNSLGDDLEQVARLLTQRAPVFLRSNLAKCDREHAIEALRDDGIDGVPDQLASTAIKVIDGARKIRTSDAFQSGLVELQDAGSQAVVENLPPASRVLDYCAGGGGKSLALAATGAQVFAHDTATGRMGDIPERARRAGVRIECVRSDDLDSIDPFPLVLCDAPCSGTGAWRRSPDGKWRLTQTDLDKICEAQLQILNDASQLVHADGSLAYVTCSLLNCENINQVETFCEMQPGWYVQSSRTFTPLHGGDGFFLAVLRRL